MSGRRCVVCGCAGPLQWHHLAGRVYAMRLGAWACRACHAYLHARLAAGGIDLRCPTVTPAVRAWAVTRGTSETIAAALIILDAAPAAVELRRQACRVGRILVASQPPCAALSPRPLIGIGIASPRRATDAQTGLQAVALLALAWRAASTFDDTKGEAS